MRQVHGDWARGLLIGWVAVAGCGCDASVPQSTDPRDARSGGSAADESTQGDGAVGTGDASDASDASDAGHGTGGDAGTRDAGQVDCMPVERCNGFDDDCDQRVDEGYPGLFARCSLGTGACAAQGIFVCGDTGTGVHCDAAQPAPRTERCNGFDDDCDGRADEDFPDLGDACDDGEGVCRVTGEWVCTSDGTARICSARAGSGGPERCNGLDDDCDGHVDEGFFELGAACAVGVGPCRADGVVACDPDSGLARCDAVAGDGGDERCNGVDDDCDGETDEGFPSLGDACVAGLGECAVDGVLVCAEGGLGAACGAVAGPVQDERCDGRDNDCDGATDEAFADLGQACSDGSGPCVVNGHRVCDAAGTATVCSVVAGDMSPEVCDGVDNDCNGAVDDGFVPQCSDDQQLEYCDGGVRFQSCAALDQTCLFDQCIGVCTAGVFECVDRMTSRECNLYGQWREPLACFDGERCDRDAASDTRGQCVDNPLVAFGKASSGGDSVALLDGVIHAQRIVLPWDATLWEAGLFTSTESSLGHAVYGIYDDAGGEPGTLLIQTDEYGLIRNASNPNSPDLDAPLETRLLAGPAPYWVVARVRVPVGAMPELLVEPGSADGTHRVGSLPGDSELPAQLAPGATTVAPGRAALWMAVHRY